MATSTNSTHAPSTTSRTAPQSSTPAQLFYGARGRSGSSHRPLSSPVRTTFGPGSPVRSTFGEQLPPIRAGEPLRPSSPSTHTQTQTHHQRNPSPLGGPTGALILFPRLISMLDPLDVVEQIPLTRLPSKQQQSREALIPSAGSTPKQSSADAGFGAMLLNATPIPIPTEQGGLQVRDERDKEKGWGDSVGGVRNPRESIVRFTRARSRSHSSTGSIRSSGSGQPRSAPAAKSHHSEPHHRPPHSSSGWQPDIGPVVRNSKGKIVKQHQLIPSETRWFFGGHLVTGGGTRRVPSDQRTTPGQDDWAYSVGATGYAYESEPATTPTTPEKRDRSKRNRVTLIPYPFVFSVLLVLGTAGTWMGTTCVWWWKNVSPGLAGAGAWLVLLVVVSMGKTVRAFSSVLALDLGSSVTQAFTDPGIVPRNLDLTPTVDDDGIPYARDIYVRGIP
ncbi:DHHC palmitoyltransferase [Rhizoctonia solani]|uniref:DHHC palmitoyltransferase n=1 Tax=Rhizoctonia solani TaxID=456999 RepID=A0A8H7IGB3_9AGAM|nr:DHHC palmitoyltransferase [Rhizoctonia solani]